MHDYLGYLRILFAVIKQRNGKEKAKFCWNIRNVTYNKEEKDGIEKAICSQIIKNCEGQVFTLTQPLVLCSCKEASIAACIGTEALRLDCTGYHALTLPDTSVSPCQVT